MRVLFPVLAALCACRPGPTVDPARSEVYEAGVLFSSTDAAAEVHDATLLDGRGRVRWRRSVPGKVLRIRRARDGKLLVMLDGTGVQRETLDGEVLDAVEAPDVHHDVLELDDGRWAWLEHDQRTTALGNDPSAPVATDTVAVAEPGGERARLFSFFDDYPVDPWWVCKHVEKDMRIQGHHQWTHSNSVVADPTDPERLLVLVRNFDAAVEVDATTGAFLGQLGGRDATLPLLDQTLDHPHMSQITDEGHLLVFDNGLHTRRPSRVVELARTPDGLEEVWSFEHPEGESIGYLGDARRLPGGNTLIAWSSDARLTEVTPGGDIVWDLTLDDTKYVGRIELWEGFLP